MMPELGRSLVHEEGVALLREWIDTLPGSCDDENEVADQNTDFQGADTAG